MQVMDSCLVGWGKPALGPVEAGLLGRVHSKASEGSLRRAIGLVSLGETDIVWEPGPGGSLGAVHICVVASIITSLKSVSDPLYNR